jgi:hypothetical protein
VEMESKGLVHSEASLDTRLILGGLLDPACVLSILAARGVHTAHSRAHTCTMKRHPGAGKG